MSKRCVICQKELVSGLDEFGRAQAPLCSTHYFECYGTLELLLCHYFQPWDLPAVVKFALKLGSMEEVSFSLESTLSDLEMKEVSADQILTEA